MTKNEETTKINNNSEKEDFEIEHVDNRDFELNHVDLNVQVNDGLSDGLEHSDDFHMNQDCSLKFPEKRSRFLMKK